MAQILCSLLYMLKAANQIIHIEKAKKKVKQKDIRMRQRQVRHLYQIMKLKFYLLN